MNIPILPTEMIEALKSAFFQMKRSIILAPLTFIQSPEISTPQNAQFNTRRIYPKSDGWYSLEDDGTETKFDTGGVPDWVTFTPTVTQGVAVAATVTYARYWLTNNTVIVQVAFAITGAGTNGIAIVISGFPAAIQPVNAAADSVIGVGIIRNSGTAFYHGAMIRFGVNDFRFLAHNTVNFIGGNPTFALANNDKISFQASYEV